MRGIFASYGLPKELVSDNVPQLASSEFRDFLKKNGVKHTLVPAYHPASNGAAEHSVQIVKSTLKKHLEAEKSGHEVKRSLQQRLNDFLLTYRITPQSTTGRAPAERFLKHELRTRFSLLSPDLTTKVRDKQERQANVHDPVKIQNHEFKENDIVSVRNYFGTRKWEQGKVIKSLGRYWYLVQVGSRSRKAHIEQLLDRNTSELPRMNEQNGNETRVNLKPFEPREMQENVPPVAIQSVPPKVSEIVPSKVSEIVPSEVSENVPSEVSVNIPHDAPLNRFPVAPPNVPAEVPPPANPGSVLRRSS